MTRSRSCSQVISFANENKSHVTAVFCCCSFCPTTVRCCCAATQWEITRSGRSTEHSRKARTSTAALIAPHSPRKDSGGAMTVAAPTKAAGEPEPLLPPPETTETEDMTRSAATALVPCISAKTAAPVVSRLRGVGDGDLQAVQAVDRATR